MSDEVERKKAAAGARRFSLSLVVSRSRAGPLRRPTAPHFFAMDAGRRDRDVAGVSGPGRARQESGIPGRVMIGRRAAADRRRRRSTFRSLAKRLRSFFDKLTLEQVLVDLLAVLLGDQHDVCLEVGRWRKKKRKGSGRSEGVGVANASFREKRPERV